MAGCGEPSLSIPRRKAWGVSKSQSPRRPPGFGVRCEGEGSGMPYVTSVINLKGGVGKTTITLALAHFLVLEHHKRVLVVDLDPQTNATVCLIPEQEWKHRDETGRTLYQLFADQVKGTHRFDADEAIVRDVSNIGTGVKGLDLLPSSLRLIRVQDRVTQITDLESYEHGPIFALQEALEPFLPYYDHILIDCPPSLGVV